MSDDPEPIHIYFKKSAPMGRLRIHESVGQNLGTKPEEWKVNHSIIEWRITSEEESRLLRPPRPVVPTQGKKPIYSSGMVRGILLPWAHREQPREAYRLDVHDPITNEWVAFFSPYPDPEKFSKDLQAAGRNVKRVQFRNYKRGGSLNDVIIDSFDTFDYAKRREELVQYTDQDLLVIVWPKTYKFAEQIEKQQA